MPFALNSLRTNIPLHIRPNTRIRKSAGINVLPNASLRTKSVSLSTPTLLAPLRTRLTSPLGQAVATMTSTLVLISQTSFWPFWFVIRPQLPINIEIDRPQFSSRIVQLSSWLNTKAFCIIRHNSAVSPVRKTYTYIANNLSASL